MVRETRLDVIKTQKADFTLGLIPLNQLAGEDWEEIRTHASRNFWISLLSLFGCQVLKKLWYMLLPSFLQHIPSIYVQPSQRGKKKHNPLPQKTSECKLV